VEWQIGGRAVRKYLALVYARRRQEQAQRRPHEILEIEMTFETILRGAIHDRDWAQARGTLVDMCKFKGLAMGGGGLDDVAIQPAAAQPTTQILVENLHLQVRGMSPIAKTARLRQLAERRQKWIETTGADPGKLPVTTGEGVQGEDS
jgi:hypothetical protein